MTLTYASESANRFCEMLGVVARDGYDLGVKHYLELGVFGNAGWLIAHDTALELILRTAEQQRIAFQLTPSQQECRRTWAEFISARRDYVRQAADRDFVQKVEAGLRRLVRYKRILEEPCDIDHEFSNLDVYECFTLGSEGIWGDVGFRSELRPLGEELREYITGQLLPEIAQGLQPEWRHIKPALFFSLEIPWLPDSFWWRHLSSPI